MAETKTLQWHQFNNIKRMAKKRKRDEQDEQQR